MKINQKVRNCRCVSSKLRNNFLPPNHFPKVRLINEQKRNEFFFLLLLSIVQFFLLAIIKKFINFSHGEISIKFHVFLSRNKKKFNKKNTFERRKKETEKKEEEETKIKRNYKHIMVHAFAATTKFENKMLQREILPTKAINL